MDEATFFALLKQFGPFVMLLGFFVWRDKQREERLGARLDTMQDRYAATMETIVKDNTGAMSAMADAAKDTAIAVASNTQAVNALRETVMMKREASTH